MNLILRRPWPSYLTAHHLPSHPAEVSGSFSCKSLANNGRKSCLVPLTPSLRMCETSNMVTVNCVARCLLPSVGSVYTPPSGLLCAQHLPTTTFSSVSGYLRVWGLTRVFPDPLQVTGSHSWSLDTLSEPLEACARPRPL